MISVNVFDKQGQQLAPVEVDETVLGAKVRKSLLRQAVQMYENNQHVCTKGTLTRGMVSISTRKLYRQKHTGNARMGSDSTPQRRGGGVAFAPQTRDISYHMPKQARREATRSALLSRLQGNEINLISDLTIDAPKTKIIVELLKTMGISGRCLFVIEETNENLWKSARNIPGVTVRRAADLNAYDLLQPDRLLFTQAAFNRVIEALNS
jgi:large subunit ribosomal protein L4